MLKLNKVEVGLYPASQLQGMSVIHFDLSDDKEAEYEKDENGKPTQEAKVKNAEAILDAIKKELDEKHIEEEWIDFLLAKKYGVFTNDDLASEDNVEISDILFKFISHMSHEIQNEIEEVEFRKRPPMFVFYGTPKHYTGLHQFYENFNVVLCKVDPNNAPENMFAFLEMQKHTFCNIEAVCKTAEEVDSFYSIYIQNDQIKADPNRTTVIIEEKKGANEIVKECDRLGVRVVASLKSVSSAALKF